LLIHGAMVTSNSPPLQFPYCSELASWQYDCIYPNISSVTYEYEGCPSSGQLSIQCFPLDGVNCTLDNSTFYANDNRIYFLREIDCYYTNGFYFFTAMGLSIFLGLCGVDRCYLGYWGLGVFKLFTIGGFGIWWLVDVFLISIQHLGPTDGSYYIVGYNGPRLRPFYKNNETLLIN
jgi:TM2 domain-containing membrane protein YozV